MPSTHDLTLEEAREFILSCLDHFLEQAELPDNTDDLAHDLGLFLTDRG